MKGTYCLLQNTKVVVVKNVCNQTVLVIIDFHCMGKKHLLHFSESLLLCSTEVLQVWNDMMTAFSMFGWTFPSSSSVSVRSKTISENVAFVFLQNKNVWFLAFVFLQNVIQLDLKCSKDKLVLLLECLDLVHNVHIVSITHLHAIWLVLLKYYKEFKYDFI